MMKVIRIISIFIVLCIFFPTLTTVGQQESESGAELSILPVNNKIPPIIPDEDNFIEIKYVDRLGINWTNLSHFTWIFKSKEYKDSIIGKLVSFWTVKIWWPNFRHRDWKSYLGYTSVRLETEIIGDPKGWTASIHPNTIPQSTDGTTADLRLRVNVDELAAENTVIIKIKATRYLKDSSPYGSSYFSIPVKSEKLNYLDVKPIDTVKEVPPDSIVNFEIEVANLGYFIDTFVATVESDDDVTGLLSDQSFVLNPRETRTVTLYVYTQDTFFDPGTTHTLNISAYSLKYPDNKYFAQVQVTTRGFYFSPLLIFSMTLVIIILIMIYVVFFYVKEKRDRELFGKPDKPWTIPKEKKYLEKLKEKDKEEYDKVLQMMKDEYQSALLWFNSYRNSMKQDEKGRKQKESLGNKFTNFFKGPHEKSGAGKSTTKEEKITEETKDMEKDKASKIEPPKKTADQHLKEKALLKIKREQEKQKLKTRG